MISVPTISKNSPLKIDEVKENYQMDKVEKNGRLLFAFGIFVFILILVATFAVYSFWNTSS